MKLGKDWFFWLQILFTFLRSILAGHNDKSLPEKSPGQRTFEAIAKTTVKENEDDKRTGAELDSV